MEVTTSLKASDRLRHFYSVSINLGTGWAGDYATEGGYWGGLGNVSVTNDELKLAFDTMGTYMKREKRTFGEGTLYTVDYADGQRTCIYGSKLEDRLMEEKLEERITGGLITCTR